MPNEISNLFEDFDYTVKTIHECRKNLFERGTAPEIVESSEKVLALAYLHATDERAVTFALATLNEYSTRKFYMMLTDFS